jgi:DNA repair protein RecN (Recombination protein N)
MATSRGALSAAEDRQPGNAPPGLIFDEVDAGIGGRVADVVGRRLRGLGSVFQVLCITHLPQIAAYADTHFLIEKRVAGGRTRTTVRRLDDEGRVAELARMLGGEAVTDGVRASAREMLAKRARRARR